MELMERLRMVIAEVRREFVPDPRLGVYDVGVLEDGPTVRVVGETSEPDALEALRRRLALWEEGVEMRDEVQRLPDPYTANEAHAIVASAVAPLLAGPFVSEPHLAQAVLGQHLVVLRQRGRWLNVRGEDGYLGWVHRGYVHRLDERAVHAWKMGMEAEACISLGAEVVSETGEVIARLPWGARFLCDGTAAILPDGMRGRASGDFVTAARRHERFPSEAQAVVGSAGRWIGVPYVWGGITQAGADCSGLVQAVFRMHGVELPRDSDQQSAVGEAVDVSRGLSALRAGDLLFFAEEPGRVSHVAISTGGTRIIHSSLGNGGVRRNDLNGDSGLEAELRRLLVVARRVV
jgi:hypothetical protein